MPDIKLWYFPGACSLAPHILLREAGLKFELVKMSVETLSGEYEAINPKRRVPALSIDGEIITENPAVMIAISNFVPEKQFLGKTPMDLVRIIEWTNWISGTVHGQAFGGMWRPHRFTSDPEVYDKIKAQGLVTVKDSFKYIEERLTGIHAVGDAFTIVDVYLLAIFRWGQRIELPMEKDYPKFTALVSEVSKREAAIAALEAEELPPVFKKD
ncbi:hypothetical protein FQN49_001624 [Arthroderma sp. PD_2]|nr:hypothetical protein FQN49_001624 [Arthroderma sp. PD_2]